MITYSSPTRDDVGALVAQTLTASVGHDLLFVVTKQTTVIALEEPSIVMSDYLRIPLLKALGTYQEPDLAWENFIGRVPEVNRTECKVFIDPSDDDILPRYGRNSSSNIYLGIPFLRVAYVWMDYENNHTSIAKAKQGVAANKFIKISKEGIMATLGGQNYNSSESPQANIPVLAIAGGSVGGVVILLGFVGYFTLWRKKKNIPDVPPPPLRELEGVQRHEMTAGHGQSEILGSTEFCKELAADHVYPVELPCKSIAMDFGGRMSNANKSFRSL
ncbi:hypothetical protein H072_8721 [Dactylellina haptotyla CBS 200.50]|uniref:Peptidase A1 domain-containing protein n=1 Tax=Dactylellina haptotyla (strain CBS 200.50) TaxID=1284197 RepID=S8A3I2_DACHA|nr:hypothetical protein H072_8721 [Dactylellina haptotyla CBS 200.50]